MTKSQRAYRKAQTPQSFPRRKYETHSFFHCINYSTSRYADVDVDCTVTYQIVPSYPKPGVRRATVELVDVVQDVGGRDQPMSEFEFDQWEDELLEAAYEHMESLPSKAEVS